MGCNRWFWPGFYWKYWEDGFCLPVNHSTSWSHLTYVTLDYSSDWYYNHQCCYSYMCTLFKNLGIPQCSLVKCGYLSFGLDTQNTFAQNLGFISMYFMLSLKSSVNWGAPIQSMSHLKSNSLFFSTVWSLAWQSRTLGRDFKDQMILSLSEHSWQFSQINYLLTQPLPVISRKWHSFSPHLHFIQTMLSFLMILSPLNLNLSLLSVLPWSGWWQDGDPHLMTSILARFVFLWLSCICSHFFHDCQTSIFFCSLYTLLHSHHPLMSVRSASTATTNQGSGTKNKPPSTTELCINLVREFITEMKLCRKWSKHSRNLACMIRSPLTKSNQPSPASLWCLIKPSKCGLMRWRRQMRLHPWNARRNLLTS